MLTFCLVEFFFAVLSFSLGSLYAYHLPNMGAQILLFIYFMFPYENFKLLAGLGLGAAAVSSGFCTIIAFVRAWRYFFFPAKEHFDFFIQCCLLLPLLVIQLVFYLYEYRALKEPRRRKYYPGLYSGAVYFLFVHDFIYASLFIYSTNSMYTIFGYTQFVVHSCMMVISYDNVRFLTRFFSLVWAALLVQHAFVLSQYFGGIEPFSSSFVLVLISVYVVANVLYLLNAYQLFENNTR